VVQIDLGQLEFIDVAGVRAIVRAAAMLGPGRELVVERLAPPLRRVFGLVGRDRAPGLRLAEEVDQ
jgi:anti-anti-sigma regulatory factor